MSPEGAIVIVLAIIGAYYVYARQGASGAVLPYVPYVPPPASEALTYEGMFVSAGMPGLFSRKTPDAKSCTNLCKASPGSCNFVTYNTRTKDCAGFGLAPKPGSTTIVKAANSSSDHIKYLGTKFPQPAQFNANQQTETGCMAFCDKSRGCVAVNVTPVNNWNSCKGYAMAISGRAVSNLSTTWIRP